MLGSVRALFRENTATVGAAVLVRGCVCVIYYLHSKLHFLCFFFLSPNGRFPSPLNYMYVFDLFKVYTLWARPARTLFNFRSIQAFGMK